MTKLSTRERFQRMYAHQDADRVPILDGPWATTIERWHREGLPEGVDYVDYFDLDHVFGIHADNSPRYEAKVLEQTDDYVVHHTPWGVTLRNWTHAGGTPEFLDFTIKDPDSWRAAKERMTPSRDRVNWDHLERHYRPCRERGDWIMANLWFGFDITHSWMVGTDRLLMAMLSEPEWCMDMFETELNLCLALFDMVWDAGYHFDEVHWPDDMGYKGTQFFSLDMYRALVKPFQQRAVDWAHAKGAKVRLHSCGDVNPFIPEFIDMGMDGLNPLEVKAGMRPKELKARFGSDILFHGGVNAVLWEDLEAIEAEMRDVVPVMKENGGYIFASDHSIPDNISLENFRYITDLAKDLGSYD